jgi:tetratricopeptide (TPR) repeat protein
MAALRYQPENANAHFNLGNVFATSEKWSEAADQYAAALQMVTNNAAIYYGCGLANARLGRRAEAIRLLTEALRLNPGDMKARRELQALQAAPP